MKRSLMPSPGRLEVHIVPAAPIPLKLQAYADNFR